DMVPPGNVKALAEKIMEVLSCPERMSAMSERNLLKAKSYTEDILQKKREEFYLGVREKIEDYFVSRQKRKGSMG
ncbi:MAG: glycosyltransferase, partial [Thermoproteota archaeon]